MSGKCIPSYISAQFKPSKEITIKKGITKSLCECIKILLRTVAGLIISETAPLQNLSDQIIEGEENEY